MKARPGRALRTKTGDCVEKDKKVGHRVESIGQNGIQESTHQDSDV